jgi:hypothetical protein
MWKIPFTFACVAGYLVKFDPVVMPIFNMYYVGKIVFYFPYEDFNNFVNDMYDNPELYLYYCKAKIYYYLTPVRVTIRFVFDPMHYIKRLFT